MSESSNGEYGTYSTDDEDQLPGEDTLGSDGAPNDVADELDRGYSPPETWSAAQGFGNTPYEEAVGESFDQRLAQEEPDPTTDPDGVLDEPDEQAEAAIDGGEVGRVRAGRLVAPDQGLGEDVESDLVGRDVGIDGAAASAEEAAMHVVDEDDLDLDD
ncbi:hypothetical protein FE634_06490 [Nocardioides dongxiaopingii]|uniref:DUF5709 domain-containing protein n=1 Tax=Nocardioides TaxID=1839 RepID=UPI0010C76B5D|nr:MULTISPECIES: DUF5709 domain-containing protein [Nocardioides]QCW50142.1 hypothetical protein FE634_06490 [Nocardioides sp. S-1144]